MSAKLPDRPEPETLEELFDQFDNLVDVIIDNESDYISPSDRTLSTMIDFTQEVPVILREGIGLELVNSFI
jgi:tRNA A37 threonylcarbamoyladenosine synthetase subunit TsaC/SUA5/YrdC